MWSNGRRQGFKQGSGQTGAGIPDLDRDQRVGGAVVVAESARNALTDDVVGLAGGEPGNVCFGIVVRVHVSFEVTAPNVRQLAHPPCRHDTRGRLVVTDGVVVDSFKPYSVGSDAFYEPVGLSVVDLPSAVSVADGLLDIGPIQMSFVKPEQGMSSPNEVL